MSCEGPLGPTGEQGIQGIAGQDGTVGTDGIDSDDGAQGPQGVPGPGTRLVLSGEITSDDMVINIPTLALNSLDIPSLDVYVCPTGFECVPLPVTFLNEEGLVATAYFLGNSTIRLIRGLILVNTFASTGNYIIILVI
ncbi:MAG: collagen-like protein [Candidatus Marinimicrobia bacterium]|nr:collagen-like protein [Candidatus Neomarinimicrobiota bacterium]